MSVLSLSEIPCGLLLLLHDDEPPITVSVPYCCLIAKSPRLPHAGGVSLTLLYLFGA